MGTGERRPLAEGRLRTTDASCTCVPGGMSANLRAPDLQSSITASDLSSPVPRDLMETAFEALRLPIMDRLGAQAARIQGRSPGSARAHSRIENSWPKPTKGVSGRR